MKYYAVARGIVPGIYTTWSEAEKMVKGFPGATYKSFPTKEQAIAYMEQIQGASKLVCKSPGVFATAKTVKESEKKRSSSSEIPQVDNTITIYTDGSFREKRCGFGVAILTKDKKITAHGRVPTTVGCTNNVAELYAIYVALSLIRDKDVTIHTDSRYSILCLEGYCKTWGAEKPNYKLIHAVADLMTGRKVYFKHVYGHVGIELNEEVDRLAEIGRSQDEHLIIQESDL